MSDFLCYIFLLVELPMHLCMVTGGPFLAFSVLPFGGFLVMIVGPRLPMWRSLEFKANPISSVFSFQLGVFISSPLPAIYPNPPISFSVCSVFIHRFITICPFSLLFAFSAYRFFDSVLCVALHMCWMCRMCWLLIGAVFCFCLLFYAWLFWLFSCKPDP